MAQLCVTVTGRTMAELRRARDSAAQLADLVEVRLDSVERPDAVGALDGRLRPVIGQRFPLNRAADAHAVIESRATVGKTLLVP